MTRATNPLPIREQAFLDSDLLLLVDGVTPGRHEVQVKAVIDRVGSGEASSGREVVLDWPFTRAQNFIHRLLVIPTERQADGSFLATSAGLPDREALRLLVGLDRDDSTTSVEELGRAFDRADAVGDYAWTVDAGSQGLSVLAELQKAYAGEPPARVEISVPETTNAGGPWTFFDGSDRGAEFGLLFLAQDGEGAWRLVLDRQPWSLRAEDIPQLDVKA